MKDLQLVWTWAMNEGGANQPAPIVHNGVIYLNNPGNILQALDGKTGELIWENRYGANANARRDARHRDLRRQDLSRDERRAPDGVRRPHRQDRLGHDDRRSLEGQLQHQQRSDRRQRQGHSGPRRLPDVPRREVLHQRLRRRRPASKLWRFNTIAIAGPAGRRHVGHAAEPVPRRRRVVDHRQLRSRRRT